MLWKPPARSLIFLNASEPEQLSVYEVDSTTWRVASCLFVINSNDRYSLINKWGSRWRNSIRRQLLLRNMRRERLHQITNKSVLWSKSRPGSFKDIEPRNRTTSFCSDWVWSSTRFVLDAFHLRDQRTCLIACRIVYYTEHIRWIHVSIDLT